MGNFAENLNLGNRFRPPLLVCNKSYMSYEDETWYTVLVEDLKTYKRTLAFS